MPLKSTYEYSGYLSTVLYKPDPALRENGDCITFTREDLARWRAEDHPNAVEWREVPVRKSITDNGIEVEGDFRNVLNIEGLSENNPRYWVALSTVGLEDDRLPVDTEKYPIIEITYRCTSERAHPCWLWTYDTGSHFGALPKSREWHTVARNVQYFGFPRKLQHVILRLYSPTRSVESIEVAQIRFREMSPAEREATTKSLNTLVAEKKTRHFDVLDQFLPLGVYMDAQSSKRLAAMLGISAQDYWEIALDDIATHHHNTIVLANADRLAPDEWKDLLQRFERHKIKVVVRHDFPLGGTPEQQARHIEEHVKPHADSDAIFARTFSGEPIENDLQAVLAAKDRIEEADPRHPVAVVARYPNAYPLFAPFFSASGIGYFTTRRPWDMGRTIRTHEPLARPQQFWAAAPAFMYPTQTPEWSTCPEMRLMVNLSFANGARGWFAYSYHNDPVWLRGMVQRTLTGPFLTFSDLWLELAQRMKRANALSPLFLRARAEETMDDWFARGVTTDTTATPAGDVTPMSQFRLRGDDFSVYMTVSNNTREMTSVNIDIPADVGDGYQIYDLSHYLNTLNWTALDRQKHIEMFPGQSHIILVTNRESAERWRESIASRLIESDLKQVDYYVGLAESYGLKAGDAERIIETARGEHTADGLGKINTAKESLINLLYSHAPLHEAQSALLEASSALCACDGGLCRLMVAGKRRQAEELGREVLPLGRELIHLRVELRAGNGAAITQRCVQLCERAKRILDRIRSEYPRSRSAVA